MLLDLNAGQRPAALEIVSARIPPEIRERAKRIAAENGVSESRLYRAIITSQIEKYTRGTK